VTGEEGAGGRRFLPGGWDPASRISRAAGGKYEIGCKETVRMNPGEVTTVIMNL
jgi:hypothetical protein